MGHQYAVTTNQQTHPVFTFVPLKMCKLLEDSFSITRHRCRGDHCGVTHCENLEIQNAVFSKDATGLKTSTEIYCSVYFNLVYPSEDLAILILEFDDIMVKTPLLETTNHSPGLFS